MIVRIKLVLQEDIMNGGYKRFLEGKNRELMFNGGRVSIGKDEQQQKKKKLVEIGGISVDKNARKLYI